MSKQENEEKLKSTREAIYKAFHEIWLDSESIDERGLEQRTYKLMNKLREIGGI